MPAPSRIDRRTLLQLPIGVGALGAVGAVGTAAASAAPRSALSENAWTFGLMSDTQWGADADGENPGSIAGGLQRMINERMIDEGAAFLVQVGDNVDREEDSYNGRPDVRTLPIKGELVQPLYDAGIGFYTLRGNHESSATAGQELPQVFPQHMGEGENPLGGATNFSSPSELLKGLSYSFDVENVRLIMLDQFTRPDGSGSTGDNILDQLDWIEERVMSRGADMHCIIAAHKNLIGGNHVDNLFGSDPSENPDGVDRFLQICDEGGVAFLWGGHDHHHKRSVITSADGRHSIEQLIAGSDSAKFYTPDVPSIDETYGGPSETVLAEELWTLSHYLITVDGPMLYVDFYSMSTGADYGPTYMNVTPPESGWYWRERWGRSLNGQEFLVGPGESYTVVSDEFEGTTARILDGVNTAEKSDYAGRALSKHIATGWQDAGDGDASPRFHLTGIHENLTLNDESLTGQLPEADETDEADRFVLELSGGARAFRADGSYGLATRGEDGSWINAVDANHAGTKKFVKGPYREGYELGTYGVDPRTKKAWAVLDRGGVFVLRRGI
ncbi:metallophosphoesterase family protein [Brachybacterium sp. GCM10030267]|uniref:metallophosphoesterase family protein n=1 Tax=Brachybacterium sp. GCM10030267 TaxID=3273381 RepID=UPI003608F10C